MRTIDDIETLEALYGPPSPTALAKVATAITPLYRRWLDASRFCVLCTVGPDGTDASPRGDDGPVVRVMDERTLWMPDWRGNNRLDALRNIVRDGRLSLMFMVPGSSNVVRLNGRATVSADAALIESFERHGRHPKTVIVIHVEEIYFQCAKAIMRAELWSGAAAPSVPTAGEFIREMDATFDAENYDLSYDTDARPKMW